MGIQQIMRIFTTLCRSHRISTFGKSIIVDFKKEDVLKATKLYLKKYNIDAGGNFVENHEKLLYL